MREENVRMYSKEEREKAIKLYIKYGKCAADVIRELGYPDRKTLVKWYKDYVVNGVLFQQYSRYPKYSLEQKKAAVDHYLEHGCNLSRTIRALGYPSRETLRSWCKELVLGWRNKCVGGTKITQERKKEAVIALCTRTGTAKDIAKKYDIARETLYNWKKALLPGGANITVNSKTDKPFSVNRDAILSEVEELKKEIRKLKLEKDILERTMEIIKKDPGIDPKNLTNREKTNLVDALRDEYPLEELLNYIGLARSSYFYHRKIRLLPDKYEELQHRVKELFEESGRCYGYRRIHALLVREGIRVSEKVVRRIMLKCSLNVVMKKKRKYNAYQGEIAPAADNLSTPEYF